MGINKDYNVNIYYSEEEVLTAFTNFYDDVKQQTKVYVFTKESAPFSHYATDANVELHHSGGLFAKIRTWLTGKTPFQDQLIQLEITSENIKKYKQIIANGGTIVISRAVSIEENIPEENKLHITNEDVSIEVSSTPVESIIASTNEQEKDGFELESDLSTNSITSEKKQLILQAVSQEDTISPTEQPPQDPSLLNTQDAEINEATTIKQSFPFDTTEALEHEDNISSHPASISVPSTKASENLDDTAILHANLELPDANKEASEDFTQNNLQSFEQQVRDISNSSLEVSSSAYENEPNVKDDENCSIETSLEIELQDQASDVHEGISLPFDDRHPEITSVDAFEVSDSLTISSETANSPALEASYSTPQITPNENISVQETILPIVEEKNSEVILQNENIDLNESLQTIEETLDQLSNEQNYSDESIHLTIKGEDEEMPNKESFPRVPEEAKEHPGEILSHLEAYEAAQEDLPDAPHPLANLNDEEAAFRLSEEIAAEYPINSSELNIAPIDISASEQFESEKRQVEAVTSISEETEDTFQQLVEQESNLVNRLAPDDSLHRPEGLEDQQIYEAIVENENADLIIDETIGKASEYRRHDIP